MRRREFLAGSAATLALPAVARAQGSRVLKFIPQSDLTVLDPVWTTAYVTRNHGFMVFDTLYGQDSAYRASPQMVAGHVVENDGRLWQADPARRAEMARRGARSGTRLCGIGAALGEAGCVRPGSARGHR